MEEKTLIIGGKKVAVATYDHLVFNKDAKKSVKQQFADLNAKITEHNVSVEYPTSGVKADGNQGGNLYSLETASAKIGTNIKEGQVLSFYDKDKNGEVSKYEYNGTDWEELWQKKSKYMDDQYIKDELIDPLFGKAKGVITRASNSNILTTSSYYILPNSIYVDRINAKLPFTVQLFVKGIDYNTEWTENFYAIGVNNDFGSGSIGYRTYSSPKIPNVDKTLKHYIIAFDGELCRAYVNGVACEEFNPKFKINQDKLAAYLGVGTHGSSYIVSTKNMRIQYNLLRFFNYALSADEVKALYNNGRPDRFVIGNEYKNINDEVINYTSFNPNAGTIAKNNDVYKYTLSRVAQNAAGFFITRTPFFNRVVHFSLDIKILTSNIIIPEKRLIIDYPRWHNYVISDIDSSKINEWQHVDVFGCKKDNLFIFYLGGSVIEDLFEFKNVQIQEVGCIGEYVPSSLTKKVWRDTSGQGNDLNAIGTPELIYNNPYSETLSGNGAPSIVPNFIGQSYYDLTNNKKYEAFGTTAASDWKPLN